MPLTRGVEVLVTRNPNMDGGDKYEEVQGEPL